MKCKQCGKAFKGQRALGGHMSTAHARSQAGGEAPAVAAPEPPPSETGEGEAEGDRADSIRRLLQQGFSPKQIKEQFGYARSTVDQVAAGVLQPENPPANHKGDGLPVVRKMGGGVEMVTPEAVLRRYMDGEDDEAELRGMMKLRAAMLMVMDLVGIMKGEAEAHARLMDPILKLMQETRAEQDAAASRAQASVAEAAQEAARSTLSQALPYIDQRLQAVEAAVGKRDIAQAPHPLQGMMARLMERSLEPMLEQVLRGTGVAPRQGSQPGAAWSPPPGWVEKRKEEKDV